jgi:hypothetical protein
MRGQPGAGPRARRARPLGQSAASSVTRGSSSATSARQATTSIAGRVAPAARRELPVERVHDRAMAARHQLLTRSELRASRRGRRGRRPHRKRQSAAPSAAARSTSVGGLLFAACKCSVGVNRSPRRLTMRAARPRRGRCQWTISNRSIRPSPDGGRLCGAQDADRASGGRRTRVVRVPDVRVGQRRGWIGQAATKLGAAIAALAGAAACRGRRRVCSRRSSAAPRPERVELAYVR